MQNNSSAFLMLVWVDRQLNKKLNINHKALHLAEAVLKWSYRIFAGAVCNL